MSTYFEVRLEGEVIVVRRVEEFRLPRLPADELDTVVSYIRDLVRNDGSRDKVYD